MTRVLILGANGQLALNTTRVLHDDPAFDPDVYLRRAGRLKNPVPDRVTIVEGDVLDAATLRHAMQDQDVVYANHGAPGPRHHRRHARDRPEAADLHQLHGHLWRGAGLKNTAASSISTGIPQR